jgi:hypothetical protein
MLSHPGHCHFLPCHLSLLPSHISLHSLIRSEFQVACFLSVLPACSQLWAFELFVPSVWTSLLPSEAPCFPAGWFLTCPSRFRTHSCSSGMLSYCCFPHLDPLNVPPSWSEPLLSAHIILWGDRHWFACCCSLLDGELLEGSSVCCPWIPHGTCPTVMEMFPISMSNMVAISHKRLLRTQNVTSNPRKRTFLLYLSELKWKCSHAASGYHIVGQGRLVLFVIFTFETGSDHVAQTGLKFKILLLHPLEY